MRVVVLAILAAAISAFAAAQKVGPLPPLTAQVEVHVVNVDVSVTDKSGRPVLGMTKDDFEIFEDGRPQRVSNFSVVSGGAPPPSAASATPASSATRRILLIIDNNYLAVIERNRALDTVEKFFESSESGEWAVASVGHGADMLQSFTSDKKLIRAALAKARTMPSSEAQNDIDRSILSERVVHRADVTLPADYRDKVAFKGREQTYRNLMTMQNTARAVVDTARAYSAEDGKKFIVLLTGGMELNTTFGAFEKKNDFELKELKQQIAEISDAMVREAN